LRPRAPGAIAMLFILAAAVALAVAPPATAAQRSPEGYRYLSPVPGARFVSPRTTIVLRQGEPIDPASVEGTPISVTGARSGVHTGKTVLSTDGRSVVFRPASPFEPGEAVEVRVGTGLRARTGAALPSVDFGFTVSGTDPALRERALDELRAADDPVAFEPSAEARTLPVTPLAATCMPVGYKEFEILASDAPDPGVIFMAPFRIGEPGTMVIVDNLGEPLFFRSKPKRIFDFKLQPNGLLTYHDDRRTFWALDSSYAVVDSFRMGNGYATDSHDLQILPNGNALMLSYDAQHVGMDTVVTGGNPNAVVVGLIVQEVDPAGNVVFEWRSWDHYAITDADTCMVNMRAALVDYVHGNTVEPDSDGHLLISARSMHEVTKIDRNTGAIIWRLGLNAKHNDFLFPDDPRGWTAQHDVRRLPNGHITVFDNGNCQNELYSRALEYDLNEHSMRAKLVWEYRLTPDVYAGFLGNVQRRANDATMIGWGGAQPLSYVTDLHADGTVGMELRFLEAQTFTYRAFRFPWEVRRFAASVDTLDFGLVNAGHTAELPLVLHNTSSEPFEITCMHSTHFWFDVADTLPVFVAPGDSANLTVRFAPDGTADMTAALYARSVTDTQLVAERVATLIGSGFGVAAADGSEAPRFVLHAAQPSPFTGRTAIRFDLARGARVRLEVLDLQGRRVETLVDGFRPSGAYAATWEPRGAAAGVYFYRLSAGDFSQTRRFVLVR